MPAVIEKKKVSDQVPCQSQAGAGVRFGPPARISRATQGVSTSSPAMC
jgi:hypothetical protein